MMPAARGAEAEVPVCDSVHFCRKSVVTCRGDSGVGHVVSGDRSGHLPAPLLLQALSPRVVWRARASP